MKKNDKKVAVLFAMKDSIYKNYDICDVYDEDRNALRYQGNLPIIAHPPCRLWGQLSHFSTAPLEEKQFAIWSIKMIRKNGGVLEHPATSRLWQEMKLPSYGKYDDYGGWTLIAPQYWWGHKAEKKTKFYIYGISPNNIPDIPFRLGYPEYVVGTSKRKLAKDLPEITKKERKQTPIQLAEWLIELCLRIGGYEN